MKKYAKAIVAAAGLIALVAQAIASSNLSTTNGIISAAIAVATALSVYHVPNKP